MPVRSDYLLIVAGSGRMLAQAARQSDLIPVVIDLYADQDTRRLAEAVIRVDALNSANLDVAFDLFKQRYPLPRAVYGSGLECVPECVELLGRHFVLLGNDDVIFQKVQDKPGFFALLSRLKIPYPEVACHRPDTHEHWLIKPMQGEGGSGIHRFTGQQFVEYACYWQKKLNGVSGSVLFLANGQGAEIIGYNTQWCLGDAGEHEFMFAGIINQSPLSGSQERRIQGWVQILVHHYGLKGLNTLDFMVQDGEVFVLEINPRPSASLQLYGPDMLLRHIEACRGRLVKCVARTSEYCAYQVVFADTDVQIPKHLQWPEAAQDLPAAGLIIRKGQPICSMIARDNSPRRVYEKLMAAQQIIVNQIIEGH